MDDQDELAERFQQHQSRLRVIGHRMLGSGVDAEDALQETWLKLSRIDPRTIENLAGWLTTVYVRVCLDLLRSRSARAEDYRDPADLPLLSTSEIPSPDEAVILGDAVGAGMTVVLDELAPAERVAFVLHDVFRVPFADIAKILDTSTDAAKMLASRARRRIQGAGHPAGDGRVADPARAEAVVAAFLLASRRGDFTALLRLLHPDVVLAADAAAVAMGAEAEVRGAQGVAATLAGRAQAARLTLLDSKPGWVWRVGNTVKVAFHFSVVDGLITGITLQADSEALRLIEFAAMATPDHGGDAADSDELS